MERGHNRPIANGSNGSQGTARPMTNGPNVWRPTSGDAGSNGTRPQPADSKRVKRRPGTRPSDDRRSKRLAPRVRRCRRLWNFGHNRPMAIGSNGSVRPPRPPGTAGPDGNDGCLLVGTVDEPYRFEGHRRPSQRLPFVRVMPRIRAGTPRATAWPSIRAVSVPPSVRSSLMRQRTDAPPGTADHPALSRPGTRE